MLLLLCAGLTSAGEVLVAQVTHHEGLYRVEVDSRLAVAPRRAWSMLTSDIAD